jgi:phosphoadenosine phosphosulfate reductase
VAQVRLGRLQLRWCDACDLPVLDRPRCGACGGPARHVEHTPPGDVRPATAADVERVRAVADGQFGPGTGRALLPHDGSVVVLNKVPAEDRSDEVIADGHVLATMRYVPVAGWSLLPRLRGAARMAPAATRGVVVLADDAVPFIVAGGSVLAPGVVSASGSIQVDDEVIVLTTAREAVAVGRARMTGDQMLEKVRGMAVKVRHHRAAGEALTGGGPADGRGRTWTEAVEANRAHLDSRVAEAVAFIRRVVEERALPVSVSFSGGKDSLATLLLALEAGLRPPVFFVDTGLELPETVEHVREVSARHGLELVVARAESDFFELARRFGPPARDFRWCCKTQKLGPAARGLRARFPKGVLSLIGQRRYESGPRSRSARVWKNPWVPGQVGASPIQEWTALDIWLFLMSRGEAATANVWYGRGLERIGCYLCPASDLADLDVVEAHHPGYAAWRAFLSDYARATGRDATYLEMGLWRFRRLPKPLRERLGPLALASVAPTPEGGALSFTRVPGAAPCPRGGVSAEGAFDRPIDIARACEMLNILGVPEHVADEGRVAVGEGLDVFAEGAITARGEDGARASGLLERARQVILRGELCVGCGVCVARCPADALRIEGGRVRLDDGACEHCSMCLGPCPVVDFRPQDDFAF